MAAALFNGIDQPAPDLRQMLLTRDEKRVLRADIHCYPIANEAARPADVKDGSNHVEDMEGSGFHEPLRAERMCVRRVSCVSFEGAPDSKRYILESAIGKAAWVAMIGVLCKHLEALENSSRRFVGIKCGQQVQEGIVTNGVIVKSIGRT